MARTVGLGYQNFEQVIENNNFYIDKTLFIKEWWENKDAVTLITRPRRFGKTLNLSMTEQFFSLKYADKSNLFSGFLIWKYAEYQRLQGTYPVISLSFANIKEANYITARRKICQILSNLYSEHNFLLKQDFLDKKERKFFEDVTVDMDDVTATLSIHQLTSYLAKYYNKKVIILLDEYDTPMQEAYVNGYWNELADFIRSLFNSTFKENPYLERALMTGITRVSKESVFSDLNNITVVTTTSDLYTNSFGFTQQEVWNALDEYGLTAKKKKVKKWYDGFTFGQKTDIYNPWSILNYLKFKKFSCYWSNTSSNGLVGKLIQEGIADVKILFEDLLSGKTICTAIDEQIIFNQLGDRESAIWSLLLASGYLKVANYTFNETQGEEAYELTLTNKEIFLTFKNMIKGWFTEFTPAYNRFIKALIAGDIKAMNQYMNQVALKTFSYFDTGKHPSEETEPERFYHGFVLGLIVDLADNYSITSNRESGFGRYDVILEPLNVKTEAIILEFKVHDKNSENTLEETVDEALKQIEKKQYAASLETKGIKAERIKKYGFAFEGKRVLIG